MTPSEETLSPAVPPDAAEDLGVRLRRIEGQIRGITRMIEEERTCEDVVTQLLAVRAGMDRVAREIVRVHVNRCLRDMPPEQASEMVMRIVALLNKLS